MAGSSTAGGTPLYGTKSVAAAGNTPASPGVTGRDSTGKIWLYANTNIWRYDPAIGNWTWINGDGAAAPAANWGTKGVEAPTNHPGARILPITAWDLNGRLWLYGGARADINGQMGDLNDLWRYDSATNQWTWMTGGNVRFSFSGTYGTRNVAAATNHPGARNSAAAGMDAQGRFLFFGGNGQAPMADLWRYDPATNWWTWLGGSSSSLAVGAYGTQGVPSTSNRIGSRRHGTTLWSREDGTVWLFGGYGFDSNPSMFEMPQNDLWRFQPATNEWTWMAGSSLGNFTTNMNGWRGTYGTQGVEAAANTPGSRVHAASWVDAHGQLWLMGGTGLDEVEPQSTGLLNDVWRFSPLTGKWSWMAGSNLRGQAAVFGSLGVAAAANTPAARQFTTYGVSAWYDPSGSLRLIGGGGSADQWRFELPLAQEIRVTSGLADVLDGGAFAVMDAPSGGTSQTVLTLTNTGTAALTGLAASHSGTHAGDFSLTGPAVTSLAAGESTTVTISFTPSAVGIRSAALSISSNDADENPYDIALSGRTAAPEIAVEQPLGTGLTDGSGTTTLPATVVGASSAATTFTIRNTGTAELSGISITKDGTHAADFAVSAPSTSIAAGGSVTFTVVFSPVASGTRTAAIHITSNDADENPFDISLSATGNGPEIGVEYPTSTQLVDGVSSVTLPATNVGSSSTAQTFTLRNTGNQSLTGISITKDGTNSAEFTVSTPVTSISAGSSATFTVTFSPTGVGGGRSAAIHIASSDFDENPFNITLTATANAPEIVVEQPVGTGLVDGSATLTFPTTNVSSTSAATTLTIRNTGTGPLTGISVSKTGTSSAEFNVSTPVTSLAAGASTTFTITFAPTAGGTRTATLRIASNDFDENPFDITLTGTGNAPEIKVEQPAGTVLVDGVSTVALPAIGVGTTSTQSTFTVRNLGIAPLTGISITKDGTNSAEFTVSSPGTSIAPGEFAIFNVSFVPLAIGTRTAAIHIFSNDSSQSPFDIALTGEGLTPPPGAVDLGFPNGISSCWTSCVQPDGKTVIGGGFFSVLGTSRSRIARLNANNTLDFGFDPGANSIVRALAVQPDGKLIVGGDYTQIAGASRSFLARLNVDGSLDSAFDPGVTGAVWCVIPQADGRILIAGSFTSVGGTARNRMARLNADGTLDAGFDPNPNSDVYVIRSMPDGKIYAGGYFSTIGGLSRIYLARLNADGTGDTSFNANVNSYVIDIAPLADGKVMIGGYFSSAGGASRARLARLNASGTADPAFTIGTSGTFSYVTSLLPQADGKVVVCGEFNSIGGYARNHIGRVNADGTVDANFNPSAANSITTSPTLLKNGQIQVQGSFPARSGLVRLINDPATESLEVLSTSQIRWLRGGSAPEAHGVSFEISINGGTTWQPLGPGSRISGGWELHGLPLPASGQIRARARYAVSGYQYNSGGLIETLLTYSGAVDKPEIALEQPAGTNLDDSGSRDFGTVLVAGTSSLSFTLRNTGNAALTGISLTKDGANAADFTVSALPASIAAQSSVTFTVDFTPSALGASSAAIHIASNDEDENPFDLTLTGTGISPEIGVEYPTNTQLTDGVSSINLPTTNVGSSSSAQTFTIRNTGTAPLTGISITKDGMNSAEFTVSTPVTSLAVGAAATFTVTFSPTGSGGVKSATVHIASSDLDENPFTIALTGSANAQEIELEQPAGTALADGVSTVDFGPVLVGSSSVETFTIRNSGTLTLNGLSLSKTGADSAQFTLGSLSVSSLAAGASTTFTVTFVPGATAVRNAILRVASNDFDENPFDINLTGTGVLPEIAIEQPVGTDLADGSASVAFIGTNVGASTTQTFTVRNVGGAALTGLALSKAGTNTDDFTLGTLSITALNPGESTTFDVTFIPQSYGNRSAILRVASSDADENPFDINLTGTGLATEIVVEQPVGINVSDGGSKSFGSVLLGSSASLTFTIKNIGNLDLTGLSITKDGANADEFTITAAPTAPVTGPAGSTTFTVQFTPAALGTRTAELRIASNDFDENPFNIALTGTGNAPEIEVEYPSGTSLVDGASTITLPSAAVGYFPSQVTVTIRNTGTAPLTGFSITKDGAHSADFTPSIAFSSLAPGEFAVFSVGFNPKNLGTRSAAIHIASNDSNETPFDINLTAEAQPSPLGAVDWSFTPGIYTNYALGLQPDGKIVIAGSQIFGRLNADGTQDFTFSSSVNNYVRALCILPTGKIMIGGDFTQVGGGGRNYLARLNADGSLDTSFNANVNGVIYQMVTQADGKLIFTGAFTQVGGVARYCIARLNADGTLDAAFDPNATNTAPVYVVRPLLDGRIMVGGLFNSIGGVPYANLARLNQDGSVDTTFNANVNWEVSDIAELADGKIMIGGRFSNVGGVPRSAIARLFSDGSLDSSFSTTISMGGSVSSVVAQADGKVILNGPFTSIGGIARSLIGRINPNGTVDESFNPAPNHLIANILLLKNGKILTSGSFPAANGLLRLVNDPATESLEVLSTSRVRWLRTGAAPEASYVTFELSTHSGATWQVLGVGTRIPDGWEINGLNLPNDGQIRSRATYFTMNGYQGANGLVETITTYSGAVDKPEIALEQPAGANLADGGSQGFADTLVAGTSQLTFTLKNTGNAALTGISLTKDGTNAADFTVSSLPTSLAAQSSVNFTVDFTPSATGARTAAIHIASDDEDENPFDLAFSGAGISPEIVVEYPTGTSLTDGVSSASLPTTSVGSVSSAQTFTIRNTGTAPLTGISITKDGTHSAEFSISTPVTSIAAGASATFTVTFSPTGAGGAKTAAIHIASNDFDENPFTIAFTGTGNAPEIEVEQPAGSALVDGVSTVDFGPVLVGSNVVRTFTIRNTGALTLSGLSLSKAGTDSANFTLGSLTTSLAAGGSTTFTVTFAPGATVTRNAVIRIASDDFDENPFDIAVTGVGVVPEIAIEQPEGVNLTDGVSTSTFGSAQIGSNITQSFTVRNTGTAPLTGLALSKAGTNTADFTLGALAVTTLNPGENTTFDVTFIPTAMGSRSAILRVASSDADENPFDINLSGTGLATEIVVEQPVGTNVSDGGSKSFGSVLLGSSASLTFTIKNIGNLDLTGLSITKDGANADEFTITAAPTAPVTGPAGSTTFTVQFTPTALGSRSAAIHIASNDADENPYDIQLTGAGTSPEVVVEYPAGTGLQDGVSVVTISATNVGSVGNITVTLRNTGTATLTGISISKDGDHSGDFGVSTPATVLNAGSSTTFTVSFMPTALGTRTAAIHITSNDLDENPFDIQLTATATSPEIDVEQPAGSGLVDGVSTIDYGPVNVGSSLLKTYTVRNTGTSSLTSLSLSKAGTNSTLFTVSSLGSATLAAGASTTFTVSYAPNVVGSHSAIIRLASSDLDENPFDIGVTGSGTAPEIAIEQPVGTNLTDNVSSISFPATAAGSSSDPVTFTVRNTGSATLSGLALSKAGTNTADFVLGALGATTLAPAETTTFTVIFSPTAGGTRTAALRVASNDADENPFDIALSATAPTIVVEQPVNFALTSGVSFIDFGELPPGSPIGRTFRIRNTGTAPLSNIVLTKSGANPGDFTVGTPGVTTIAPGAFTTFSVIFNPVDGGYRNALLSIGSNATNVSNFFVSLTGTGLGPEIGVTTPPDGIFWIGSPPPPIELIDAVSSSGFGSAEVGAVSVVTRTFTIRNDGLLDLNSLALSITGAAAADFSANALTSTSVAVGGTTTFTVSFTPAAVGNRSATLHIASNDYNEASFDFELTGTGLTNLDAWRLQHFGFSLPPFDSFLFGEYEDHQDPDRDGMTNLMEFATGAHPTQNSTSTQSLSQSTGGQLIYTYQRSKDAVTDGVIFTVQHNATLDSAGWSSTGITETILSDNGTIQVIEATIPAPIGSACFTRLRVQRP
jgi:uncharacterized delta-60 repeat protein